MIDDKNLMMVNRNLYISSLKALHVYLEQLSEIYLSTRDELKAQGIPEEEILADIKTQIEIVSNIAEALTMAGFPPQSDPGLSN